MVKNKLVFGLVFAVALCAIPASAGRYEHDCLDWQCNAECLAALHEGEYNPGHGCNNAGSVNSQTVIASGSCHSWEVDGRKSIVTCGNFPEGGSGCKLTGYVKCGTSLKPINLVCPSQQVNGTTYLPIVQTTTTGNSGVCTYFDGHQVDYTCADDGSVVYSTN